MSDAQPDPARPAPAQRPTMSRRTARSIMIAIIGLCLLAIVFIFQPVWKPLYTAGCIMVVAGGLSFNLIPFANTRNSLTRVLRVGGIVLAILVVAVLIAIGCVELLL